MFMSKVVTCILGIVHNLIGHRNQIVDWFLKDCMPMQVPMRKIPDFTRLRQSVFLCQLNPKPLLLDVETLRPQALLMQLYQPLTILILLAV